MKKQIMAAVLSAATLFAFPMTSMAAESSSQDISVVLTAEPEYTITIPESVSMGNEGIVELLYST